MKKWPIVILVFLILCRCTIKLDADYQLKYCEEKVKRSLSTLKMYNELPRSIADNEKTWKCVSIEDWTSGFWPGTLWYAYELSKDAKFKQWAIEWTRGIEKQKFIFSIFS